MKYKFKFQRILDVKETQEENKKNQIAEVRAKIAELDSKVKELEMIRKEWSDSLKNSLDTGLTIKEIREAKQYEEAIDNRIIQVKKEIEVQEVILNKKREEYLELRKEKKSFESLKEKDFDRYKYSEMKKEEALVDQIVTFNKFKGK